MENQFVGNESWNCAMLDKLTSQSNNQMCWSFRETLRKQAPDFSDGLGSWNSQSRKVTDNLILKVVQIVAAKYCGA